MTSVYCLIGTALTNYGSSVTYNNGNGEIIVNTSAAINFNDSILLSASYDSPNQTVTFKTNCTVIGNSKGVSVSGNYSANQSISWNVSSQWSYIFAYKY